MTSTARVDIGQLTAQARAGDNTALGQLSQRYGDYLKLLARLKLGQRLPGKVSGSDLVQETFLEAKKNFSRFRGTSEQELMAWLRRILAAQIAQSFRHHYRDRRDVRLEQRLAEDLDRSSTGLARRLIDTGTSPSMRAARHEAEVLLANGLAQLKPEHREVIILRNLEELSFQEVARRMGRSTAAIKSLWVRALTNLRRVMGELGGK